MELIDLSQQMKVHKWRIRFAFLPVKRIKMVKGYIEEDGYYWLRIVFEIECGLVPIWTAYAHMNDGVRYSNA